MSSEKPYVFLYSFGPKNSGSSTTVSHLMFNFIKDAEAIMESIKNKDLSISEKYISIFDSLRPERDRGKIFEPNPYNFDTPKYHYEINTPNTSNIEKFSQKLRLRNPFPDVGILTIDGTRNISEQNDLSEFIVISNRLGLNQLIITINKMDDPKVNYSQTIYNNLLQEITQLLTKFGYKPDQFRIIPLSATKGDNIMTKSPLLPWYSGPSLFECLDSIPPPYRPIDKPLRFTAHSILGNFSIGVVESGILKNGTKITASQNSIVTTVNGIANDEKIDHALPGTFVGFVSDIPKQKIGEKLVFGEVDKNSPLLCKKLTVKITVLYSPELFKVGSKFRYMCCNQFCDCTIVEISQKVRNSEVIDLNEALKKFDEIVAVLEPAGDLVAESVDEFQSLGRFALTVNKITLAVGFVTAVEKKQP